MTSLWQYMIVDQAGPEEYHVVQTGTQVLTSSKPDVAAHTFLMAWRGKTLVPPSSAWPRIQCWARQPSEPGVVGVAFGRDWA